MTGPRIAMIGTGNMGGAMVGRFGSAGLDVIIHNRTRSRAEEVARHTGATVADTPRAAAEGADVVLVSLFDDRAVAETFAGPYGIVAGVGPGKIVADLSTIDPRTAVDMADLVRPTGAAHVDAPVSGSVPLVEAGQLTVLAAGDEADVDRLRPVLAYIASTVLHIGPTGTGSIMKLAVNNVLEGLNLALSEALVLAEATGVERGTAYDAFEASAVAAPYLRYKRAAFEHPQTTPPAFTLDLVGKDLDLILALAGRVRVPMVQTQATSAAVRSALDDGYDRRDISAIAEHLRQLRGRSSG